MQAMREEEIRNILADALYEGNAVKIDQAVYELRRRFVNKGFKNIGMPKIAPVFLRKNDTNIIENEKRDNFGVASNDGVPPSARASVRELLSYITHRDPEVQVAARTMTYRMLNLMGKTIRGTLEETNVMTAGDIARIAGVDPSDVGTAVFADMRAPEFGKLRSDMRRLAIGLTKGDTSPMDVIHEIGHLVMRSGILKDDELNAIREAYRLSNDATKKRIQAVYGTKYANRIDSLEDDLLAEEWFAESLAEYMAARITRGDIGDEGNITLRNAFDRAIDRMVEYVAYLVNGLVGRNDIKQQFRRLFLFGDMFEKDARAPLSNLTRTQPAIHPKIAADAVYDNIMSSPTSRMKKIKNFIAKGVGYNPKEDMPVTFYHGTPSGYVFDRNKNPDVVMKESLNGNYGPGIYLTNNPNVASQVYAERATAEAMRKQIEKLDFPNMEPEAKGKLQKKMIEDIFQLEETRKDLADTRSAYSKLVDGGKADDTSLLVMREKMDGLINDEKIILKELIKYGIKPDPLVVPTFVRVIKPADFTKNTKYKSIKDPFIQEIIEYMKMTESIDIYAYRDFRIFCKQRNPRWPTVIRRFDKHTDI